MQRALLWRFNVDGKNKTYLSLIVKYPMFLPDFNQIWYFTADFHWNFMEIGPVGTALVYTDRRKDMTKVIGAFSDYANALKMGQ